MVASNLRTNGALALAGTLYGAVLYLVNFKILAPTAVPVLEMANQPFELVVHVVFGTLLALALFRLPSEGQASVGETHRRSQVTAGARAV